MKYAFLIADKTIRQAVPEDEAYGLIRYHDEEIWECLPEHTHTVGKLGVQSIEKAAKFLKLRVPLSGEWAEGQNWADIH